MDYHELLAYLFLFCLISLGNSSCEERTIESKSRDLMQKDSLRVIVKQVSNSGMLTVAISGYKESFQARLANCATRKDWPKLMKPEEEALHENLISFCKRWLQNKHVEMFIEIVGVENETLVCNLLVRPEKDVLKRWEGANLAEKAGGWLLFDFNVMFIEHGLSPYIPNKQYTSVKRPYLTELLKAAESDGKQHKRGIWGVDNLANHFGAALGAVK